MVMWLTSAHRLAASHSLLLPCCCEPRDASGMTSRNAALSAVKTELWSPPSHSLSPARHPVFHRPSWAWVVARAQLVQLAAR
jgi:hypothetical protein